MKMNRLACGVVPDNAIYEELMNAGIDVHMMGDCWRPGMIASAVADGARWGSSTSRLAADSSSGCSTTTPR
jgi:hypothetical protein